MYCQKQNLFECDDYYNKGDVKMNEEMMNQEDMEFEAMMEQRIQANFTDTGQPKTDVSNEKLKEMNKKLPSWSLEPPYSFLK